MSDESSDDGMAGFDSGPSRLTPTHHLFLQALLSRRVTPEDMAIKIHKRCCDILKSQYRRSDFGDMIAAVNGNLHRLGFTLKRADDPHAGEAGQAKPVLVFCNTRDDELSKCATDLSVQEISYFRELIREIMEASNRAFSIKFNDAVSLGKEIKPALAKSATQNLLASFVSKGWLHRSEASNFSLSVRSLHELESYIENEFEEVVDNCKCQDCGELVTLGVACNKKSDCKCVMHTSCFLRSRASDAKCPSCRGTWPARPKDLNQIGEAALSGRERKRASNARSGRQSGAVGFQPAAEEEDESQTQNGQQDGDEDEEEEEEPPARRQKRGRPSQLNPKNEEDELATPAPPTRRGRRA